jgi:hypothetical protein
MTHSISKWRLCREKRGKKQMVKVCRTGATGRKRFGLPVNIVGDLPAAAFEGLFARLSVILDDAVCG